MDFDLDLYGRFFVKSMPFFTRKENYFKAFGLEDVTELSASLTAIAAPVLIGVDAFECESVSNGGDAVNDTRGYAFILVTPVQADDYTDQWREKMQDCYDNLKQIRNFMLCSYALRPYLVKDMTLAGYGPLGDNLYGDILNFRLRENQDYRPGPDYFDDLKPLRDGTL